MKTTENIIGVNSKKYKKKEHPGNLSITLGDNNFRLILLSFEYLAQNKRLSNEEF